MSQTSPGDGEADPAQPRSGSPAGDPDASIPWQQRLYQKVWLWAVAAILFWLVSYVIWGWVDLLILPEG